MTDTTATRTLREMVRVLASRFLGMVLILAIIVGATILATWYAPRIYRSTATLLGQPGEQFNPLADRTSTIRDRLSLFVTTQRQLVTSDYVIASALMLLDGDEMPDIPTATQPTDAMETWDAKVAAYTAENVARLRQVRGRIDVVTPGGPDATFSQTFTIRVDWPESRERAADAGVAPARFAARRAHEFTARLIDAYLYRYTQLETRRLREASKFLTERSLAEARRKLEEASTELQKFQEQLGGDLLIVRNMVGTAVGAETGAARLSTTFREEVNRIEGRLAEVRALREQIQKQLDKPDAADLVVATAVINAVPSINDLQRRIVALKLRINELVPRYTEEYKELRNAREELAGAREDVRDQLARHKTRLEQEQATLEARRDTLERLVERERGEVEQLAGKVARYEQLVSARDTALDAYNAEQRRVIEAATAEQLAARPILVSVVESPSHPDPDLPRRPIVWLNILVAVIAGVVLALVYAFLADHFDHSIRGMGDAERYLEAPVLASVPKLGRRIIRIRRG